MCYLLNPLWIRVNSALVQFKQLVPSYLPCQTTCIIFHFSGSHTLNPSSHTLKPLVEKRFEIIHQKLDFYHAKQNCINLGGKLFEPHDTFENSFVVEMAKKYGLGQYWIGIVDHNLTTSSEDLITWNHYEPLAKPKPIGGCDEICTAVCFCSHLGLWKDQCCSMNMHSVCDYDTEIGKSL